MRCSYRVMAIVGALALNASEVACAQAGTEEVEVRFVQTSPAAGLDRVAARVDGRQWYVVNRPLISSTEIERITVYAKGSTLFVDLKLTVAGDRLLVRETSKRPNSHIGFFVEGQLVETWEVQGPFVGGSQSRVLSIGVDTTSMPPGSWRRLAAKWISR